LAGAGRPRTRHPPALREDLRRGSPVRGRRPPGAQVLFIPPGAASATLTGIDPRGSAMRRRWAALATLALLSAAPAWAQGGGGDGAAEDAVKAGVQAYLAGRYEEALADYQKAAALAPKAAGPYREMGKAYEALKHSDNACWSYAEYLRRRPSADDAQEIKSR